MGAVFGHNVAALQVGLLKEPVVLVREADFVGFITAFVANFAGGHERSPLLICVKKYTLFKHQDTGLASLSIESAPVVRSDCK